MSLLCSMPPGPTFDPDHSISPEKTWRRAFVCCCFLLFYFFIYIFSIFFIFSIYFKFSIYFYIFYIFYSFIVLYFYIFYIFYIFYSFIYFITSPMDVQGPELTREFAGDINTAKCPGKVPEMSSQNCGWFPTRTNIMPPPS